LYNNAELKNKSDSGFHERHLHFYSPGIGGNNMKNPHENRNKNLPKRKTRGRVITARFSL